MTGRGVMLASAVEAYVNRFAVLPGRSLVLFTNNDSGYEAAFAAAGAGAGVEVVDLREAIGRDLEARARGKGMGVHMASAIVAVHGRARRVRAVDVMALDVFGDKVVGPRRRIACDLVGMSGGWTPTIHLFCQARGTTIFRDDIVGFVPGAAHATTPNASAGAANGTFDLAGAIEEGRRCGRAGLGELGIDLPAEQAPVEATGGAGPGRLRPFWTVPAEKPLGHGMAKYFHDFQNDSTAADLHLAAREGFRSVEHIKRYTTTGMGTDQGKTSNMNALGVCRIWHTVSDKIRARPGECREFTMSDPFKPVDRDTPYLLPPSLQDWLPQEHLARFVVEIVDRLDLTELERAYGGRGKTPYHPAVMVALLFYGYATGVFSSRKLELATYDSVAFRYITADTHPDHDTIAHFRKRFLEPLRGLFVQILVIAQAMGVLKIGTVSLDGTKVKANASKHKAMSWGYANRLEAQLREEVKTLLEQAARADTEASPGLDIPEELERREARLAAIERAKAEIERRALKRYEAEQAEYEEKLKRRRDTEKATGKKARGREPKAPEPGPRAKDQVNFTDEESRIMPSSEGFVQGYNAQAAVDIDSHVIVAEHVSDHTNDKQELAPALRCLDERQEVVGQPRALLADAGYFSDENVKRCEAEGIEPYIASGRERHHRPLADRLAPVPERPAQADGVAAMGHRMKTPEGRALYAKRKSTVETVFGVIKEVMGFRRFHLRGLEAVQGEWALVCMAWNLKRMHVAVA